MGNTFDSRIRHTIRNCVSWKNKSQGFYANHSPGGTNWYNNTAYNNGAHFDMYSDSTLSGSIVHVLKNNIAFPNKNKNIGASIVECNSWDLNITPANGDFISVSDSGWTGPRKPDGSLPDIPFLKLKSGGNLIDKGTDVVLPFTGQAPDLAAYEFGAATAVMAPPHFSDPAPVTLLPQHSGISRLHIFDLTGRSITGHLTGNGSRFIINKTAHGAPQPCLFVTPGFPVTGGQAGASK